MLMTMHLEGWNHVPVGFGATFDIDAAPWWLRAVFGTPFIDRFAHPHLGAARTRLPHTASRRRR